MENLLIEIYISECGKTLTQFLFHQILFEFQPGRQFIILKLLRWMVYIERRAISPTSIILCGSHEGNVMDERVKQQYDCQSEKIGKAAMSFTHVYLTAFSDTHLFTGIRSALHGVNCIERR